LSLPLATEKASLPAIIVTPSSPTSTHDFSIAFLAPPAKQTFFGRVSSFVPKNSLSFPVRARTSIIIVLIFVVMVCHVVTQSLAFRRPHLEFSVQTGEARIVDTSINWFDFRSFLGNDTPIPPESEDLIEGSSSLPAHSAPSVT
ncbi:hypothetical protein H0H93_003312, partial [Arthromyces matolae]